MPNVGIIDTAIHPPLGILAAHIDTNGPYPAGSHTLDVWNNSGSVRGINESFGCIAVLDGVIPPELGQTIGWDGGGGPIFDGVSYALRMLQIVMQHQLLSGQFVNTQVDDQFTTAEVHLWREAIPGRMGLYVAPMLSFNLFFLTVF